MHRVTYLQHLKNCDFMLVYSNNLGCASVTLCFEKDLCTFLLIYVSMSNICTICWEITKNIKYKESV